jgi:GNAT superfamily N-acetyltransferase
MGADPAVGDGRGPRARRAFWDTPSGPVLLPAAPIMRGLRIVESVARPLDIEYRPMSADDVDWVPTAHQGEAQEVLDRIATIGSSAWLAFDGGRHIGQLQFRLHVPDTRSPNGLWDPLWWMDFGGRAPALDPLTLAVCCCHVGQLDDTADRDEGYLRRGIGGALLDHFLEWASGRRFAGVIAKATPDVRAVMEFLGGFPVNVYRARGFDVVDTWVDRDLEGVVRARGLSAEGESASASVACCVLRF